MSDKDIKMLIELAKRLRKEKTSKEEILASFVSAGILTEDGKFTKPYSNLGRFMGEVHA